MKALPGHWNPSGRLCADSLLSSATLLVSSLGWMEFQRLEIFWCAVLPQKCYNYP